MAYRWSFSAAEIRLVDETGTEFHPTAQQIFACAFMGATSVGESVVDGNPIECLPDISFSRYPASPAVRITGLPGQSLTLTQGFRADGVFAPSSSRTG